MKALHYTAIACLLLTLGSFGCAEVTPDRPQRPSPNDMASDIPDMTDAGGDIGEDTSPDIVEDMPQTTEYRVCVLNNREPFDPTCAEDKTLDFGVVYAGQMLSLKVRIDNQGTAPVTCDNLKLDHPRLSAQWATYSKDDPPVQMIEQAPLEVGADGTVFVQVDLMADLDNLLLDGQVLTFDVISNDGTETVTIPLRGQLAGCAMGTANCNNDITDGCEVNTADSLTNCGGCNLPCALENATEQCIQGSCTVDQCDFGFKSCDNTDATGCESNINTSKDHCGDCNQPCDYTNAEESCEMGTCTFQRCETGFKNCDNDLELNGCEINTDNDPTNCGDCGINCSKPNAEYLCVSGSCSFDKCAQDHYDLDGDANNGCEYNCTFISADDVPDINGVDANCDGLDGDASRALFVDGATGNNNGPGSRNMPMKTIMAAINRAKVTNGLDHIYISKGTYTEQVFVASGVSLYGGFDATQNWQRGAANTTTIQWGQAIFGRIVTVTAINIQAPTTLDQLRIVAQDTNANGVTTYGVYCEGCNDLTISNSTVQAGKAGAGQRGSDGTSGSLLFGTAGNGGRGGDGDDDGSRRGTGGSGGSSACGRTGGVGGLGGPKGDNRGSTGGTGISGTPGGTGGAGGDPGRTGSTGGTGANGATGANGSGGTIGGLVMGYWQGNDGTDGNNGTHGNGGGGGGGGGGQGCFLFCDDGAGNGGGGGGGGGCYGSGGKGGQAGGSSFGVFLWQSTGISLDNNVIRSGDAGNGGAGGIGGSGSTGGFGGAGGAHQTNEIGRGGTGGRGGRGGNGGNGGGGAGGLSYAVYRVSTTVGLPANNTLTFGDPGVGGGPTNVKGENGTSGTYK